MKKFLVSLLALALLAISGYYLYTQFATPKPSQAGDQTQMTKEADVTTSVALQIEETLMASTYPNVTFPQTVNQQELFTAMADYFSQNFTADEQAHSRQQLTSLELQSLASSIKSQETFKPLKVEVDQVKIQLGETSVYVPRLIMSMTYDAAEQLLVDHDVQLMNHAFSIIGNRLVMVAYYDTNQNVLTPRHIASSTKSLFYAGD